MIRKYTPTKFEFLPCDDCGVDFVHSNFQRGYIHILPHTIK